MPKKKPYFPNHADQLRKLPEEVFRDLDGNLLTFDDLMEMKFGGPLLPIGILCIIREHKANGKVKEYVYRRIHAANKKIKQLWLDGNPYTLIDQDHCEHIEPIAIQYNDPLA